MKSFPIRRSNPVPVTNSPVARVASLVSGARRGVPYAAPFLATLLALILAAPDRARACACGCGVFEVGTSSMFPEGSGAMAAFEYDYQDQDHNWSGSSQAPAADNPDKEIRTDFFTLGYQYMFSRSWGGLLSLPYESRYFRTTGGATGSDIVSLNFSGLGDIRLQGIYTGFSPDMSGGLTFGLKLPTGSHTANDAYGDVDRDSEIGTGSTDILLGGFRRFNLDADYGWSGFVQGALDLPVLTQDRYRPGAEFDAALGAYYSGLHVGRVQISPMAQLKLSLRGRDGGANAANPVASGFARALLAPGVEIDMHPFRLYADVERPVYQRYTGNQLAAPALYKLEASVRF
jgi:hypothetical protein